MNGRSFFSALRLGLLALGTVGIAHPALGLFLETLAGVVAYPPAALLMVRGPSRDLLVRALDAVRPTK